MMTRSALTTLLTTVVLLAGCGDDKDWDQEIILQLFKPNLVNVGNIKVEATQSGVTRGVTVGGDIFTNCDTNTVRIIPKEGKTVSIKLTWTSGKHAFDVNLPAKNPVKVVLGSDNKDLKPSGCAPTIIPDGGPTPDGPSYPTGFMCSNPSQCTGGLCIASYMAGGTDTTMPKGYCSRDCSVNPCPSHELCFVNKDNTGKILSQVCLKKCKLSSECREKDGYHCTPAGDVCLPK
jgi:hypothetical protein